MRERNLHKKIEEQNTEEKKVVWQDIEPNICQKKSSKTFFVRYKRLFVALASCFVCIAVILPVTLRYIKNDQPGNGGEDDGPRYCTSADYEAETFTQTLKEYSETLEEPILFLDWYDIGTVYESNAYKDKKTDEILCVSEKIINGLTGDDVSISITSKNIVMDFIEGKVKLLNNSTSIGAVLVKWRFGNFEASAYFEYEDYCYYLNFYYPMSEQTIFDVVEEMLSVAS